MFMLSGCYLHEFDLHTNVEVVLLSKTWKVKVDPPCGSHWARGWLHETSGRYFELGLVTRPNLERVKCVITSSGTELNISGSVVKNGLLTRILQNCYPFCDSLTTDSGSNWPQEGQATKELDPVQFVISKRVLNFKYSSVNKCLVVQLYFTISYNVK